MSGNIYIIITRQHEMEGFTELIEVAFKHANFFLLSLIYKEMTEMEYIKWSVADWTRYPFHMSYCSTEHK